LNVTSLVHLTHSLDPQGGGVTEAVVRLNYEFKKISLNSSITCESQKFFGESSVLIAHGLWQWPSFYAWKNYKTNKTPYLVFPHGMLDPWFKKNYPLKHIKKQIYWWFLQEKILRNAYAVCFTTEEERLLAQETFSPYQCKEVVTGLGVDDPPGDAHLQTALLHSRFAQLKNKKVLLFLGRFHPKKGVDLLIKSFLNECGENEILVLAGPLKNPDSHLKSLQKLSSQNANQILWTGMLEGDLKWGALRVSDALILPSHQENFGMVIAEALSVGTPVFLTNKVNLWREVVGSDAGIVANDDQMGIDHLIQQWRKNEHFKCIKNTFSCFREKLHISKTAEKIISMFPERS
jgi:glycosyltransferase involved in cell wall biosynthesis